jgi:hypothetical protein
MSLKEGIDYTIENNNWVFTSTFLLNRGYCCNNGCRNCPYNNNLNMKKDLYMKDSPKQALREVIKQDDLIYDGKNLVIPAYWASTLADYLKNIDESKIGEDDREDLTNFKSFIFDVEFMRNDGN